jgi:hypothetical protein
MPFDIGEIGPQPRVGERTVLTHRLSLKTRRPEVRERIFAAVVVVVVAAHERSQRVDGVRIEYMRPRRRDVECSNLGNLVRWSHRISVRAYAGCAESRCHLRLNPKESTPGCRVFGIEVIRRLKPAPAVAEVQVNRVTGRVI